MDLVLFQIAKVDVTDDRYFQSEAARGEQRDEIAPVHRSAHNLKSISM
jgi:hypothetical protein